MPRVRAFVAATMTRIRRLPRATRRRLRRSMERYGDAVAGVAARLPEGAAHRVSGWVIGGSDRGRRPGLTVRAVLSGALPTDPLGPLGLAGTVEVLIPCHGRDAELLPVVLAGVRDAVPDGLTRIRIVTPDDQVPDVRGVPAVLASGASVEAESDVLHPDLLDAIRRAAVPGRSGYVLQQVLKFVGAAGADADACLVVDADTVLLAPRTWVLRDGRQLLAVAHERHPPYGAHHARVWPDDPPSGISFVTHHQVMQPDVVRAMFGPDTRAGLVRWISASVWDVDRDSGSEYHDYGAWLRAHQGPRAVLGAFRNARGSRDELLVPGRPGDESLEGLRSRFPSALSVSLHAYL